MSQQYNNNYVLTTIFHLGFKKCNMRTVISVHVYFAETFFFFALVVKNPPTSSGNIRDAGSIPGLERSPGGKHGNPLHYSCLENTMDRGTWWATAHSVTELDMKHLSTGSVPFINMP